MELLGDSLWQTIGREALFTGTKRIAVAYVSTPKALRLRPGDTLIANVSEYAVRTGQTSATALLALDKRVTIYSDPRLHAKVYILPRCVIVGSANLSKNSGELHEAATLDRAKPLRQKALQWFEECKQRATRLTRAELVRLSRIPVTRRFTPASVAPSLLEALELDHPVLQDYAFAWAFLGGDLTEKAAQALAKNRKILTNDMLPEDWTWWELPEAKGLALRLRAAYRGKPTICFYGVGDERDDLKRFTGVDDWCNTFVGSVATNLDGYRIRVVYELNQDTSPGLALGRSGWKRLLLARLNKGLLESPRIRKTLSVRDTAEVKVSELKALFRAGAN